MKISSANTHGMKTIISETNRFTDTEAIPWTPFVFDGMYFKLLDYTGDRCTLLSKLDANLELPIHQHLEPVELFILEGSFGYRNEETGEEQMVYKHGYMYEPPGTAHRPISPTGGIGISILHGKIRGFDENGNERDVGPAEYYRLAKANNAVAHLNIDEADEPVSELTSAAA